MKGERIEPKVDHACRHAVCEKCGVSICIGVAPSGKLENWTHASVLNFGVWAAKDKGGESGESDNAGKDFNARSEPQCRVSDGEFENKRVYQPPCMC